MDDLIQNTNGSRGRLAAPFLSRVRIDNYKSIGKCDVALGSLTVLVGRNGSGKSNFLDALRFVVDGLQTSLDHAIKSRGGVDAVRRRSTGHPRNFAIEMEIDLPHWKTATNMPPAARDRLYLVNAAGFPPFREVYDALLAMGFYNLNPVAIKVFQSPDAGEILHRDGGNIASVIGRLSADQPEVMQRIKAYLAKIVPGIVDVQRIALGPHETLEFRQRVVGSTHPWKFYAASMSDGTLRALGTLVAVTQLAERKTPVRLVGIEEPESALHPAAAGALMDALREAASHTQVVVTSHSPDLVEQINPDSDTLLAVQSRDGNTEIGPVDAASQAAIRDHLYTPGELLRMDQLDVDQADFARQQQSELFNAVEEVG